MLNSETRRERLEALLARVRRNRGYLKKERSLGTEASPEPKDGGELEPSPVKSSSRQSAEPLEVALPPMGLKQAEPAELPSPGPLPVASHVVKEAAEVPTETALSGTAAQKPLATEVPSAPISETEPELPSELSLEEPLFRESLPEPAPEPEPEPTVADIEVPQPEETRVFAPTPPKGEVQVASFSGRREREWTLAAVLDRAWKLGAE